MEATTAHGHKEVGSRAYVFVWVWLLALTGIEVFLAYEHLPIRLMIVLLMGLSVAKAALIMAYFMHLRFERVNLIATLVPVLVVTISLFAVFFPDSFRLLRLRIH